MLAFHSHFERIEDPRLSRRRLHSLRDILFLSVCATIAGADGPSDIEAFGKEKLDWLRRFIPLPNGIPSHDTIGRVFSLIQPTPFQEAFLGWIQTFFPESAKQAPADLIPIDGKTLRGSRQLDQNPLHLVSAWSAKNRITLGQVAVDEKSNEITAIPRLLEVLELRGAIVSIDAMGCQKAIAQQIVLGEGDYVLALKDNQPTLAAAVEEYFQEREEEDFSGKPGRSHQTNEPSRGRKERRDYTIVPVPESMASFQKEWAGLNSLGRVVAQTERDGKLLFETRYYISSLPVKVKLFAESVRSHWRIENSLHWILDMTFQEDASRIHKGNAAENSGFLRKFVISLLNQDTSKNSMRCKRKRAVWSTLFLEKLLFSNGF